MSTTIGFNAKNNLIWSGAAEIARAGYQAQCAGAMSGCDPENAPNVVSFKYRSTPSVAYKDQEAVTAVQDQICSGNPVILEVNKPTGDHHFLLAKAIVFDQVKKVQTFRVNNPGTVRGENQLYSSIKSSYPSVVGYDLFRPSSDPSMMFITAPTTVHFVVTDPLGRRSGYDPTTNTTYAEIPGANYSVQSIDTPNEDGFSPETLVKEQYFSSTTDVVDGAYQIQVFAVETGSYYIDSRSFDAGGTTNRTQHRTGTLTQGSSVSVILQHSASPPPKVLQAGNACDGNFAGSFNGNISVTSGQTCNFIGGTISGNVQVNGGKLILSSATVKGNVQVTGNSSFEIDSQASITGNFQVQNTPPGMALSQICDSSINGNLQIQNSGSDVHVGTTTVICGGNTVAGNLIVQNNDGSVQVDSNSLTGNLLVQNNKGSADIIRNVGIRNLQCQNNAAIAGGANTARQKLGQCSGF